MSSLQTRPANTAALSDYLIVDIAQALKAECTRGIVQEVTELIEGGHTRLVLNLSQTTYLSCVGIGSLVHLACVAEEAGGRLLLTQVAQRDIEALNLVSLDDALQVVEIDEVDVG